jgi:two-component system sensor histidine kinase VicK
MPERYARDVFGRCALTGEDMGLLTRFRTRPWWIAIAAVAGLLLGIVLAGLVGLGLNEQVRRVTDSALRYDVDLEDEGDDLRVAVLDVRHHHRNVVFGGSLASSISQFDRAHAVLLEEIAELEQLGIRDHYIPQPAQIREMADRYYADFRPAVDLAQSEPAAFARASDLGLARLQVLDEVAESIDKLGEERATAALESVERTSTTAGLVLLSSVIGLIAVGATLAYAVVRVIGDLDRLSKAKTDFIADVSHELRAPLTLLRGNAEVGLRFEANCVHAPRLKQIVTESTRMAALLDDLLLLARSESASAPLKLDTVEVAPFLTELVERAEMLAGQRGVSLEPSVSAEGQLLINRARIEQAVLNLVDNAAKYSPPGGCATLNASTRADELWIEVVDRGAGIPEADLNRIFDRFYRVEETLTPKLGGAGLGLSIVKSIVEAHGGRVGAASRLGEGTRIWLSLPLQPLRGSTAS